jgi:inorganic phosphate transporter, PiT family
MDSSIIPLALGFVLIALVAGNNLSVCFGGVISSRVLSRKYGIALAIAGYASGLLLQGRLLLPTITQLMPNPPEFAIEAALSIAIIIFAVSQVKKIPQSLSITFTMILVGMGLASGVGASWAFLLTIVAAWIIIPIISFVSVLILTRGIGKRAREKSVWTYVGAMRVILILASLFVAFTLGANTIGLIHDFLPSTSYTVYVSIIAIIVGSIAFSAGPLGTIGGEIIAIRYVNAVSSQVVSAVLVEIATLLGIPMSNTQTFVSGIYGASASYKSRMIMKHPLVLMMETWLITAIVALVLGFLVIKIA